MLACAPGWAQSANPSGPVPHTADGHPDLSGVWDHPFSMNMAAGGRGDSCGAEMKGCKMTGPEGGIPMTPLGEEFFKNYNPANFDATAHCNPMGSTRSMNAPVPTQIVQRPEVIVFPARVHVRFPRPYSTWTDASAP